MLDGVFIQCCIDAWTMAARYYGVINDVGTMASNVVWTTTGAIAYLSCRAQLQADSVRDMPIYCDRDRAMIYAMQMAGLWLMVRIAPWVFGILGAPGFGQYHPVVIESRIWFSLTSSFGASWYTLKALRTLFGHARQWKIRRVLFQAGLASLFIIVYVGWHWAAIMMLIEGAGK